MELIDPIEYFKVDKLSDEVYSLGLNFSLRMNVSLSKTSQNSDKRFYFHREYEYPSRTTDTNSLVTIKRNFDYYMSIESNQKTASGEKLFIRIGPSEFYIVKKGLDEAFSWFTDSKYSKLFAFSKGELVLMPPIPEYTIQNLPMGKFITLSPIIISRGLANADKVQGIRFYFCGDTDYTDMPVDKFMGLHYSYTTFTMYHTAVEMINYLGRPEFGFNRYVIGQQSYNQDPQPPTTIVPRTNTIEGRFITPKGTKRTIKELE